MDSPLPLEVCYSPLPLEVWYLIAEFIDDGLTWKSFLFTCRDLFEVSRSLHKEKKDRFINILLTLVKKYPRKKWNWDSLCVNPNIPTSFLATNLKKTSRFFLQNPNITEEDIDKYIKYCPEGSIYFNNQLSLEYIETYKERIDWERLSRIFPLSIDFIEKYKGYIDWFWVAENPTLTFEIFEKYREKFNPIFLAASPIVIKLIENNIEIDWSIFPLNTFIKFEDLEKYMEKIDISGISSNPILTRDLAKKYEKMINWNSYSQNPNVDIELLENHLDEVNWGIVIHSPYIPLKFIEAHMKDIKESKNIWGKGREDRVLWIALSSNPSLTIDFIEENIGKIHWGELSMNKFKKK